MLSPAQMNDCLRAIANHPATIARSERSRAEDGGWLHTVWGLADAEHLGATEAEEIARVWAQTCDRYSAEGFDTAWSATAPAGGIGVGSLIKFAVEDGINLSPWGGRPRPGRHSPLR